MPLSDALPILEAKGPWQRFHFKKHEAIHFGRSANKRFDDPYGKYGVLYMAEDEFGAFVETFLRNPEIQLVDYGELDLRALSEIEASEEIRLVDLTGKGLQKAGVTGDQVTGGYEGSQSLSREIFEHSSEPDGIRYRVKHDLSRIGIALFERPRSIARISEKSRGGILDSRNQRLLGELLHEYDKSL